MKVLVYGYGKEGRAAEKYIRETSPRAAITIFDEGQKAHQTRDDFAAYDLIIRSPGVPKEKLQGAKNATTGTRLFFQNLSIKDRPKIVGITGTKGKSTTAKFCAEVLQEAGFRVKIGGNYGVPLLSLLPEMDALNYVVAELSSYQLEDLDTSPPVALCTNLYADHLDRHGGLAAYHAAKENLWKWQSSSGLLVAPEGQCERFLSPGKKVCAEAISVDFFPEDSIFRAQHWRENFGLVAALAAEMGIAASAVKAVSERFKGLPYRMAHVANWRDLAFYNDSIATNPRGALAAAKHFGERLSAIILGGQDRGMDYESFIAELVKTAPNAKILLPEGALQKRLTAICEAQKAPFIWVADVPDAVAYAAKNVDSGVVLLSPAAPSFDVYADYIERGNAFTDAVKSL